MLSEMALHLNLDRSSWSGSSSVSLFFSWRLWKEQLQKKQTNKKEMTQLACISAELLKNTGD